MALSDSRSPILDFAAANAIPTYVPPAVELDPDDTWRTEDNSFDVITEDGLFTIGWDVLADPIPSDTF